MKPLATSMYCPRDCDRPKPKIDLWEGKPEYWFHYGPRGQVLSSSMKVDPVRIAKGQVVFVAPYTGNLMKVESVDSWWTTDGLGYVVAGDEVIINYSMVSI